MRSTRRYRLALVVVLLASVSCASTQQPPPTPAAQRALTADQIGKQVHQFDNFVNDLMEQRQISPRLAADIFVWCKTVYLALDKADAGWQFSAQAGWKDIRDKVAAVPALKPWVATINALLGMH